MAIVELLGDKLQSKEEDGEIGTSSICGEGKYVGLYFSAHWCPPCRGFTPQLAEFYKKLKSKGGNLEIVFISSDQDEGQFDEYYNEMPWHALPYSKRDQKVKLEEEKSRNLNHLNSPPLIFFNFKSNLVRHLA